MFKEFLDIFPWSYEEMPSIDPRIVEHEIKTYPNAKHFRQRLRAVNPRKAPAIKVEIEKLLNAGFIYPIPLTEWVSNPIPVDKNQGTICICIDFHDLNHACPEDNFPHHLLIRFWMSVQEARYSPSWTVFPDIIRFRSNPRINIILHLFVLGVLLHIYCNLTDHIRLPIIHKIYTDTRDKNR